MRTAGPPACSGLGRKSPSFPLSSAPAVASNTPSAPVRLRSSPTGRWRRSSTAAGGVSGTVSELPVAWSPSLHPAMPGLAGSADARRRCPWQGSCSWFRGGKSTRWSISRARFPQSPGKVPDSRRPCGGPRWDEIGGPHRAIYPGRSRPRCVPGSCCPRWRGLRPAVSDATTGLCWPSARCGSWKSAPPGPPPAGWDLAGHRPRTARSDAHRATSLRTQVPRPGWSVVSGCPSTLRRRTPRPRTPPQW